jgi:hypothetical protein
MALLAGRLETAPRAKVIVLYSGLWNLIVQANLPAFQVDTRNTIAQNPGSFKAGRQRSANVRRLQAGRSPEP